jgi:hypothetical protein
MAKLSPELKAILSQQKEQLLDLVNEAKLIEFLLLERFGDKQTLARAHQSCQQMELAGLELEAVLVKLEQEYLAQGKQRFGNSETVKL